jgi:hypothetical protein
VRSGVGGGERGGEQGEGEEERAHGGEAIYRGRL